MVNIFFKVNNKKKKRRFYVTPIKPNRNMDFWNTRDRGRWLFILFYFIFNFCCPSLKVTSLMGSVTVSKILNAEENKFLQNKMWASVKREKAKITLNFARNKSLGLMTV